MSSWTRERDAEGVLVHRRDAFRCWRDDDVEHGAFAASIQERGGERILGHAPTLAEAKALTEDGERVAA